MQQPVKLKIKNKTEPYRLSEIRFASIKLCLLYVEAAGLKRFSARAFNSYFKNNPERREYFPRHGEYSVEKL